MTHNMTLVMEPCFLPNIPEEKNNIFADLMIMTEVLYFFLPLSFYWAPLIWGTIYNKLVFILGEMQRFNRFVFIFGEMKRFNRVPTFGGPYTINLYLYWGKCRGFYRETIYNKLLFILGVMMRFNRAAYT